MSSWGELKNKLLTYNERDTHPHVDEEMAEYFQSTDIQSTEIEYLDLLYGLVRVIKPINVIETGSCGGLGAAAIAYGLKDNRENNGRLGHLHTMEICLDSHSLSECLVDEIGLSEYITHHSGKAVEIIDNFGNDFSIDFAYFDSSRLDRIEEFYALQRRSMFANGAVVAFHDTSRYRADSNPSDQKRQDEYIFNLNTIAAECVSEFEFHLSRGMRLFRVS